MSMVTDNFLRYVQIDTESVPDATCFPSSEKQFRLAELLVQELNAMGAADVRLDDHCYVYACIPATTDKKLPTLGFIAHMDTAPAVTGKNVHPQITKNYDGGDILLNAKKGITLSPAEYESLQHYVGQDIITSDGTTLLGADDKAGIAEIMAMASHLLSHPEIPHGKIVIAFTPDEEVGNGVEHFDVVGFGADYAYTVDGGELGEIEYENFNAANVKVAINGVSIHPGSAKGRMKNALLIAMELQQLLPVQQNPAYTEGYEGFFHLDALSGTVEHALAEYIIRDHSRVLFEQKKWQFAAACDFINNRYGSGTVVPEIKDSYYNMKEQILPHFHLIENAKAAMEELGIDPIITPIRGGTDGSRLSFMGLPCPNLCTGGHNFHGRYEYISAQSMERIVELLLRIVSRYAA
ncbi:MAG: peptidase T [Angelakisella sp.]